jgi:hypothetical protein
MYPVWRLLFYSLQTLGKTIMLVSQNDINTLQEYTLTIQKKNKISRIIGENGKVTEINLNKSKAA